MGRDVPVISRLLPLLLLVACAWRGPQVLQTYPGIEHGENVVALDQAAWQLVAIANSRVQTLDDGRMKLAFELANLSDKDLNVQVQTIFRDKDGMLTGDETGWQMVTLPGNGTKLYELESMRGDVGSFLVQVKTP